MSVLRATAHPGESRRISTSPVSSISSLNLSNFFFSVHFLRREEVSPCDFILRPEIVVYFLSSDSQARVALFPKVSRSILR